MDYLWCYYSFSSRIQDANNEIQSILGSWSNRRTMDDEESSAVEIFQSLKIWRIKFWERFKSPSWPLSNPWMNNETARIIYYQKRNICKEIFKIHFNSGVVTDVLQFLTDFQFWQKLMMSILKFTGKISISRKVNFNVETKISLWKNIFSKFQEKVINADQF